MTGPVTRIAIGSVPMWSERVLRSGLNSFGPETNRSSGSPQGKHPGTHDRFGDHQLRHLGLAEAPLRIADRHFADRHVTEHEQQLRQERVSGRLDIRAEGASQSRCTISAESAGAVHALQAAERSNVGVGAEAQKQSADLPVRYADTTDVA